MSSQISSQVIFHFDIIEDHAVSIDTYIKSLEEISNISSALNNILFQGKLNCTLEVQAPESGGVITPINFAGFCIAAAGIMQFIDSPTPSNLIKRLTGYTPAEFVLNYGRDISTSDQSEVINALSAECSKSFIFKSTNELISGGVDFSLFREAYESKNRLIQTNFLDPKIKGLGFKRENDFIIKKDNYFDFMAPLPEEEIERIFKTNYKISIESPNWSKNDTRRPWKGKNSDMKELYFRIDDNLFWEFVESNKLENISTHDQMLVELIKTKQAGTQSTKVIRVLSFNGQKVSEPLTEEEIEELMKNSILFKEDESNQPTLPF
ncbi:MAG: hypothetical protein COY40_00650 [Alphaproteobacteria bacterium CG_4_10_14_0_8_um_filter_53_9]|nr:MAG: hypothetical protein COY40_00650 [Alphaproteobacteria bacterium CG_4_10_14_0_8_um_filter_53_9]